MREANPEIATVATWERLADTHAATVAYSTLRVYVTRMPVRAAHAGQLAGVMIPYSWILR